MFNDRINLVYKIVSFFFYKIDIKIFYKNIIGKI